ncbi:ThuA domain-containing protein [Planctomonas sp. JC2975]|uniref:ThuA domain-containing protein n=1 Tax=Planctomonas sp. JC2975 TaxID=2729626 RepID=UPI0014742B32|nr:ThuA domain-containing protein [Planctomonas sp. JC2975]
MNANVVVVSGSGRYADPWHPFEVTSARVAEVLRDAGHTVTVTDDVDARLAALAAPGDVDLLVLNLGAGRTPDERDVVQSSDERDPLPLSDADAVTREGLLAYLERGGPLLALHVSSTSFGFMPEWETALGGIWVRGISMHPPYSRAHIEVATDAHPATAGIHDFDVDDERYTYLRVSPEVTELAWHELDGSREPVLWTIERGASRVAYDALGHDAASYDAPEHRAILAQTAAWLLGDA